MSNIYRLPSSSPEDIRNVRIVRGFSESKEINRVKNSTTRATATLGTVDRTQDDSSLFRHSNGIKHYGASVPEQNNIN